MPISYVLKAGLDETDSLTEARRLARLSIADCIDLCDVSKRTWYRWKKYGAPKWAVRLILSQRGTLDRFGWKDWEIENGALYFRQLSYRYYWTPVKLVLPLYGITQADIPWQGHSDNLSSLELARKTKTHAKKPRKSLQKTLIHTSG